MVQERHAPLKAHCHGCPIDLGQNVLGKVADHVEKLHARNEIGKSFAIVVSHNGPRGSTHGDSDLIGAFPLAYETAVDRIGFGIVEERRDLVQLVAGERRPPCRRDEGKQSIPSLRRERAQHGCGSPAQRRRHEAHRAGEPLRPQVAVVAARKARPPPSPDNATVTCLRVNSDTR